MRGSCQSKMFWLHSGIYWLYKLAQKMIERLIYCLYISYKTNPQSRTVFHSGPSTKILIKTAFAFINDMNV